MAQKITRDTTIDEILKINPHLAGVLEMDGMHCIGCDSCIGEPLEMAASLHNVDIDLLVTRLNILAEALEKQA